MNRRESFYPNGGSFCTTAKGNNMIPTNQFRNGITLIIEGQLYTIVSFEHVKPGKGGSFVRTKLRSINSGNLLEKTFRSGEKFEQAFLEERKIQFLYRDNKSFHFMDQTSFEEVEFPAEQLGDKVDFLKENMLLSINVCQNAIIDIKLPTFVELKVADAPGGARADTVKAATKAVVLETGAKIDVPLFVNTGDVIKIDTRTRDYVCRV